MKIIIPEGLDFSALRLRRDSSTGGDPEFDWAPVEAICAASGIDLSIFRDEDEGRVAELINRWYVHHKAAGGAADQVMEDIITETRMEEAAGERVGHKPGRA